MEVSQLKVFRAVAKHLHFTRAAKELNLTQSAVSYQISNLENSLGEKLLLRDKNRITLTPQGKTVLDYAEKLLRQIDLMKQEIQSKSDNLKGQIKIISITRSLKTPFPQIREKFRKTYKDIDLYNHSANDDEDVINLVKQGEYDIGLTILNNLDDLVSEDLQMISFGEFEMLCVVGRNHPLASKKSVELDKLKGQEWLLLNKGSWLRSITDKCFRKYNFEPDKIFETNDPVTVLSMVKDNQGIALFPAWGIQDELKSGKLIPLNPQDVDTTVPAFIVYSTKRRTKLLDVFINFLLSYKIEGVKRFEVN